MPLYQNPVAAATRRGDSGTPTIVSGTLAAGTAVVSLNTQNFNTGSGITYSTGTGLATVSVAGQYFVEAQLTINATYTAGQVGRVDIVVSGASAFYGAQTAPTGAVNTRPGASGILNLLANDTVGILAFSNGTSPTLVTDTGSNTFNLFRIV